MFVVVGPLVDRAQTENLFSCVACVRLFPLPVDAWSSPKARPESTSRRCDAMDSIKESSVRPIKSAFP